MFQWTSDMNFFLLIFEVVQMAFISVDTGLTQNSVPLDLEKYIYSRVHFLLKISHAVCSEECNNFFHQEPPRTAQFLFKPRRTFEILSVDEKELSHALPEVLTALTGVPEFDLAFILHKFVKAFLWVIPKQNFMQRILRKRNC